MKPKIIYLKTKNPSPPAARTLVVAPYKPVMLLLAQPPSAIAAFMTKPPVLLCLHLLHVVITPRGL